MKRSCKGQHRSFRDKYLALVILLLFSLGAKAQIVYTPMTAAGYQFKYVKIDSGLALPFIDTTIGRGVLRPGVFLINKTDSLPYYWNGIKFSPTFTGHTVIHVKNIGQGFSLGYTNDNDSLYLKRLQAGQGMVFTQNADSSITIDVLRGDGYTGGIITYDGTGFNYHASPSSITIGGVTRYFPSTALQLPPPDPTYSRYDKFAIDSNGPYVKVGVPAATPLIPQDSAGQYSLTSAFLVNPGDTVPSNIATTIIYDQNVEWATGAQHGNYAVNFNNTDNPYHLTKAIYLSKYQNSQIYFINGGYTRIPVDQQSGVIDFWIYLNGALKSTDNIYALFFDSSKLVGQKTLNADNGFNRNDTNHYSHVVIPESSIKWTGTQFTTFDLNFSGTDTSGANGAYVDYIRLQSGIPNILPQGNYADSAGTYKINDSTYVTKTCKNGICTVVGDTIHIQSTGGGGGGGTGTVTNVSALTLGTSGTDLSSTVANSTTTPVITLNVPTASASNRGALSATDWTTFNNKGTVSSIATGYGLSGGTITSTGTIVVDSAALSLKYLRIADTAAMLSPYPKQSVISDTLNKYANSGSITTDNVIYSTPIALSVANHTMTGAFALKSQSAYTLLGRGSGSGSPSFLSAIDSNWVTGLHTQDYYDGRYAAITTYGQWLKNGNDIYRNIGRVGINIASPIAALSIQDTNLVATPKDTSGIFLNNSKVATSSVTAYYPPHITFRGSEWNTSTALTTRGRLVFKPALTTLVNPTGGSLDYEMSTDDGATYTKIFSAFGNSSIQDIIVGNGTTLGSTSVSTITMNTGGLNWTTGSLNNTTSLGSNTNNNLINISPTLTNSVPTTNTVTALSMKPNFNYFGGGVNSFTGINFNPTNTNLTGATITAFTNSSGNSYFGTTSGSVGIGATTTIDASSILQVTSTTQGTLPPRMTTTQKNAISSPAEGLMVYDLTLHKLYVYDGTTWQAAW